MHIDGLDTDHAILRGYRNDIERLLDQPSDHDARPCPGCTLTCPTCGSKSCVCNCSFTCDDAPRMLSSDPDDFAIEAGIVALVYAVNSLRLTPPCWSCEGHYNKSGDLYKLPRVWFYARSMAYPDLISDVLSDLAIAHRLSLAWQVCVVSWSDSLDVTFAIEPRFDPARQPELGMLRHDATVIADSLMADIKAKSRHRIFRINQILKTTRPRRVY